MNLNVLLSRQEKDFLEAFDYESYTHISDLAFEIVDYDDIMSVFYGWLEDDTLDELSINSNCDIIIRTIHKLLKVIDFLMTMYIDDMSEYHKYCEKMHLGYFFHNTLADIVEDLMATYEFVADMNTEW